MKKKQFKAHIVTSYTTGVVGGISIFSAPPLGIISIATAAAREHASVSCMNLMPLRDEAIVRKYILEIARDESLDLFGVSLNISETRAGAYNIIEWFREANTRTPIVVGGIHASHLHEQVLMNFPVDYVVCGEGENTFSELCASLNREEHAPVLPGLVRLKDGKITGDSSICLIEDLDSLPFPDFSKVDMRIPSALYTLPIEKYDLREMKLEDGLPVEISRGCPRRCVFCGVAGRPWRHHSPEYVRDFLLLLHKQHGFTAFTFTDDCFTLDRGRAIALCEELNRRAVSATWAAQTRIDMVDAELLGVLKKAGCRLLAFGIETGSEKMQLAIKKNLNLAHALENIKTVRNAGINVQLFFLLGHPGETPQDVKDTTRFLKAAAPEHACFDIAKILPGTGLARLAAEAGFYDDSFWIKQKDGSPYFTAGRSEGSIRAALDRLWLEWYRLRRKPPPRMIRGIIQNIADLLPNGIAVKETFAGPTNCAVIVLEIEGREAVADLLYSRDRALGLTFDLVISPADRSGKRKRLAKIIGEIMARLRHIFEKKNRASPQQGTPASLV
ncbi:MAG: radical SAM protein [bacterium]